MTMMRTAAILIFCLLTATQATPAVSETRLGTTGLDSLRWDGPLGVRVADSTAVFHLFAPRASAVTLHLYGAPEGPPVESHAMGRVTQGCWSTECTLPALARYYAYAVSGPAGPTELYNPDEPVADPYSRAVVTANHYTHRGRTLLYPPDEFDWNGDEWASIPPEDLIIYETHVRDLTAHPSAHVPDSLSGTFVGLCHEGAAGGLSYLRRLGINAVEFLPLHEFGNLEVPYGDSSAPVYNTWNPYARNHWGYMTSYFFAPEAYYATGQGLVPGGVCGADGRQVTELKRLIRTLHAEGIAVVLDVVYNHVSQYDVNPFKLIDSRYYFRVDEDGRFSSLSGCGNDLKTERQMARRLIVDSVLYWMREYHVDGFRFDLATMIDDETLEEITRRARELNPHVFLIAEPWGGGQYDLARFSRMGWSVWNDRIRNGIKGRDPESEHGFVLGTYLPGEDRAAVVNHLMGSVSTGGGPLLSSLHAVNYLESHDDHTMGDFFRIALGRVNPRTPVSDIRRNATLTEEELRVHRLAALALCCSQGSIMIAQGQEFGRSKVIAPTAAPDSLVGHIDHNSYAKDNQTNWLDYEHASLNGELVQFHSSLIAMRKSYRGLGGAPPELITSVECGDTLCIGLLVSASELGDPGDLLILLNGSRRTVKVPMPEGRWRPLVLGDRVYENTDRRLQRQLPLPSTTGALLIREE